eukprot:scaffold23020_cov118-Isochrysis_galbana.AAC.1
MATCARPRVDTLLAPSPCWRVNLPRLRARGVRPRTAAPARVARAATEARRHRRTPVLRPAQRHGPARATSNWAGCPRIVIVGWLGAVRRAGRADCKRRTPARFRWRGVEQGLRTPRPCALASGRSGFAASAATIERPPWRRCPPCRSASTRPQQNDGRPPQHSVRRPRR